MANKFENQLLPRLKEGYDTKKCYECIQSLNLTKTKYRLDKFVDKVVLANANNLENALKEFDLMLGPSHENISITRE